MPSAQATELPNSEIAIFSRLLDSGTEKVSATLARHLLALSFTETDQARMKDLAERNQDGRLSVAEHDELMSYVRASHMLAVLHAKGRRALGIKLAQGGPHGRVARSRGQSKGK